jgi:uncharacterized protein (TIGR01777 family)
MNILITGASGLVGSSLVQHLFSQGHRIFSLQRSKDQSGSFWQFNHLSTEIKKTGFDAVVHLAGENISSGRWTPDKKNNIINSRVEGTRQLAQFCAELEKKPATFLCASAIGYYGDRGQETLDETSAGGSNFVAEVCQAWEQAAEPALHAGMRVIFGRIGMVLSAKGGTLSSMLPSFKLGIAGVVGSGRQYVSWIHIEDLLEMIEFCLQHEELEGPINMVAPAAVTNREFTKTLGRVVKRPTLLKMPAFVARSVFGQMGEELVLSSCRVLPSVLMRNGYVHRFANLETALAACIS